MFIQISSSISNNSVKHKYTVYLSKTFLFQAIQFSQTVLIQTVQFNMSIVFVHTQLNVKTVLFQAIQFSVSTQISYIWPINRTLSGTTTPDQNGPESGGNERVLRIPQSSSITGTSTSDCLASYLGHSLGAELFPLCSDVVDEFYSPSRLDNFCKNFSISNWIRLKNGALYTLAEIAIKLILL